MSDFTFLAPLWFLTLIPLAAILVWLAQRHQAHGLVATHIASAMGLETRTPKTKLIALLSVSWLVAIIALAGPSFEKQTRPSYTSSNARVLVMDMSLSLYATDIRPNRLTQARYKATDLLKGWTEGSTGLVAYAGDAYTVSPLTSDSATITNLLPNLSPDIMPYAGANAAKGVELAIQMMKNAGLAQGDIILLADDIDQQERNDINDLLSGSRWNLTILGIGTLNGAPITLSDGSLLKTDNGQTVIAKTDFESMQSLARSVNGVFMPYQADGKDVEQILAQQASQDVGKKDQNKTLSEQMNNGYWLLPFLVVPALLLFRRGAIFLLLFTTGISIMPNHAEASPWLNDNQQAMDRYNNQDYQAASEQFDDPEWQGVARYQNRDFVGAIESFSKIENPSPRTQYNLANAYAQNGDLQKAQELYEQVLTQDPNNQDAKRNLEVVKQEQQKQQQQQQQQNSQSDDNGDQSSNAQNQPQSQPEQNNSQNEQQPQQRKSQQQSDSQSDKNEQDQQTNAKQNNEQPQAKASKKNDSDQPDKAENQPNAAQSTTEQIDPKLRKLEQVENARDPSRLLRAQLLLQAQDRQPPQSNGKKW